MESPSLTLAEPAPETSAQTPLQGTGAHPQPAPEHPARAAAHRGGRGGLKGKVVAYAGMLAFPFVMVMMMFSTYVGTMHTAQVVDLPVAVVGAAGQPGAVLDVFDALDALPDHQVAPRLVATQDEARALLGRQEIAAAVVPPSGTGTTATMLVAGASGAAKTQTAQTLVLPAAAGLGWSTQVEDVAPLPSGDSSGTVVMFAAMGMMLAGYVPLSIMMMGTPHLLRLRRFLPVLAGWAVAVPTVIWLLLGPLVGGVEGHYLTFLGIGALTISAVGLVQLAVTKVVGPLAVLFGMLLLVVFGMPSSNLALPIESMPGFFQALHHVLPLPAAGEALRSILYFDGVGLAPHLVVLAVGLVVGLAAASVVDRKNGDVIPMASKFEDADTPLPALPGGPVRSKRTRYIAAAAFPGATLVLMVGLMGFSMHAPTLHDMPVAVVGPTAEIAAQTAEGLQGSLGDVVDPRVIDSVELADTAIEDQEIVAAFVLPGAEGEPATLRTASGAGAAQQKASATIFGQIAAAQGLTLTQVDVAPLTTHDVQGTNTMYIAMSWVMAGFLICTVLRGGAPQLRTITHQLPLLAGWAVGMSVALWFLFSVVIGAVDANAAGLIGCGALAILAVSLATSVLTRTVGMAAVPLVVVVMMLVGVPASGGGLSLYMVPGVFQSLHHVLPLPAAVDVVRSLSYFGGTGVGSGLLTLTAWAAAGLIANVLADRHLATRPAHPQPERFMPQR
ncbi:DUF3533 domain-containing protein [Xylanimonas allomyrinae]|uniref:DUF3533 domain-containing protein n=1 Tax=Xylanimonas allomyrinae TaxID=2509459 RepID=A0A4P6EN72_9MICO|nr:DUF3533 domain-containing protein [Xylanimonas allomyrinae]QAY64340.1 DUF3533 domain-containing protein [Xylanimonas allomyrinae]